MIGKTTFALALLLAVGINMQGTAPALARGGGAANIMDSPGYQRALQESRKRYRESYTEPYAHSPAVHPRKKWRHREQRH